MVLRTLSLLPRDFDVDQSRDIITIIFTIIIIITRSVSNVNVEATGNWTSVVDALVHVARNLYSRQREQYLSTVVT